ncbi:MAG: hypothetical protein M1826_000017 [Phylliscum demangeonii]|nr:MAG: hypothetical protein M1826_000017 [Phylliscum demangeonii]
MQIFIILAFGLGAQALVSRDPTCCFGLTASGGVTGPVGQLDDGQNRVYGNYPHGTYCIDAQGGLTDGHGRGCILTPPTTQLQCDVGARPTPGFSVACDGTLSVGGNAGFFACATGDQGSYNLYTSPVASECVPATLTADGCKANCPPPPPPVPKTCPAALSGPYEFPHLIVPVNPGTPNQAYGTTYAGQVTKDVSSLFNFDIPPSDTGKTCSLVFLFPAKSDLQTSSFIFSGAGGIDFSELSGVADASTTFANAPPIKTDYGVTTVAPGNSYTIATFPCPAGQRIAFELKAVGDTSLVYFQDFNPSPIGLYITKC